MSTGPWEIIRFSVKDTNRHLEMIDMDKELKEFTVYQIPYLRQHKHKTFELVVAQSCILELQEALGQRYNIERPDDLTLPNSGEVNVFGLQTAKEMANRRFLSNAVDAVSNGWGEGPGWCYRDAAKSSGLEARLEMELQSESRYRSVGKGGKEDNDDVVTLPEQSIEDVYIAMPEPWSNGLDFFDGGYSNAQSIAGEQSLEGGCVPMLEPWSDDPDFFDASYSNVQPISAEQPTEEVVQAMGHPLTLCPMEVIRPHCKFQQTSL